MFVYVKEVSWALKSRATFHSELEQAKCSQVQLSNDSGELE